MQRVDQRADDPAPSWEEDTIYCEATCDREDVFYEGSEDEDYESSAARKLRYEAAGQRFLDGLEPFLLTASLKGPFDKASGWINPWRSKHRTAKDPERSRTLGEKSVQQQRYRRNVSIPETQDETQNSLDCHLPSPESLRQVSIVESHPYLMEDELVKVQNWRSTVEPVSSTRDRFWVTTPRGNESARKRKAGGSDWLKKLAAKRRRTSLMESGSVNTPIPRRSHTDPIRLQTLVDDDPTASFNSIRGQHIPSTSRSRPMRAASSLKQIRNQVDEEDELIMSNNNESLQLTQPNTSTRRISPRRDIQPTQDDGANHEDELSQEQIAAAATLSSPVSQRTHPKSSLHYSSFQIDASQIPLEQQSPTRRKTSAPPRLAQDSVDVPTALQDVVMEELSREELEALESQRDQSFCFKMRPKTDAENDAEPEPASQPAPTYNEEHTWSGLSSKDDSSPASTNAKASANPLSPGVKLSDNTNPNALDAASTSGSDDSDTSSSDLSSLLSRYFDGFHTPGRDSEEHMDVDTAETTQDGIQDTIQVVTDKPAVSAQKGGKSSPTIALSRHDIVPTITSTAPHRVADEANSDSEHQQAAADDSVDAPSDSPLTTLDGKDVYDLISAAPGSTKPRQISDKNATPKPSSGALLLKKSVRECLSPSLPRLRRLSPLTLTTIEVQDNGLAQQDDVSTASEDSSEEEEDSEEDGEEDGEEGHESTEDDHSSAASASDLESEVEIIPESPILQPVSENLIPSVDNPPKIHVEGPPQEQVPENLEPVEEPQAQTGQDTTEEVASTDVDGMDVDEAESQPVAVSQQSPWAGNKLSQIAVLVVEHPSQGDEVTGQAKSLQVEQGPVTTSPEVQSPWTEEKAKLPTMSETLVLKEHNANITSPTAGLASITEMTPGKAQLQNPETTATSLVTPRPSTPEPQFTVKSFASFMSPSPERRSRQGHRASWRDSGSRLPSTQGILASAMKNPWGARSNRSDRRVSWKPLPDDTKAPSTPAVANSTQPSSQLRGRDSSPPPSMPVADLPTSQDEKFHDHFKAIIRRRNRQALLPTESQRTLGSPDPQAMAEKFIQADEGLHNHSEEAKKAEGAEEVDEVEDTESLPKLKNIEYSQDSIDIVEDVFREMSDYLETWNVDTELDQARREDSVPTPRVDPIVQSPW